MSRKFLSLVVAAMMLTGCGADADLSSVETVASELKSSGSTTTTTTTTSRKGSTTTTVAAPTFALKTTDARISSPVYKSDFAISSTYDIFFAVEVNGALSGHHKAIVEVFMPGGSAYQRFEVSFATDVAAFAGEQQAEKTASGYRVWVSMPVAGTIIEQYSLTGPWTAKTFIDAATTANAQVAFNLN